MSEQTDDVVIEILEEESKKIDPRDTAPPEGSPRWNEIYGKMKQYERDVEALKKEKEDLKTLVEEMKAFNKKLASSIEAQTDVLTGIAKQGQQPIDTIDVKINELKKQRKEALENLDYELAEELSDKIFDLKLEKKEMVNRPIPQPQKRISDDDMNAYEAFITNVEWYQKDPEMRMYANELDKEFARDSFWGRKPVSERLTEIKKRVERRFNYTSPKVSGVEGAVGYGAKQKTVSLSPEEVRLAEAFGISHEEWARQKMFIERRMSK